MMPFILSFAIKLLPLYMNIILGFVAGKKLQANQETVSKLMFYLISPLVFFNGVIDVHLDLNTLSLPLLTFVISCSLCLLFYGLSKKIWKDGSKNLMAFSAGSGATGYFGLPVAMLIFNEEMQGLYIMALLGVALYDNSLGYYITMKGNEPPRQCLKKMFGVPTLYAFFFGLLFNFLHVPMPAIYTDFIEPIKGVYVVFGMLIVGMGLAGLTELKFDFKFIGMTFLAKFLVWPLLVLSIIALDENYIGLYHHFSHQVLILISIVPLAVNTVVMANLMKCQPERAAATVLMSTLVALIYVPLMSAYFLD